ncbi:hypothetical protein SAMN06265360_13216 [Haloechinothrix alba]|uniref:Uncharacterized protein n=1 Tax=Haloechinothrix alba TaxID=664784 RepID=A0A239A7U5_9PSEU|nr:hypothetical protein [Haloechinothrix alba]SNR91579.1 hypothetical protein SAMN06265360_13216 [Haloechinothrix alba]
MHKEIRVLQAVRLKGRPQAGDIARSTDIPAESLDALLSRLVEDGLLSEARGRYKVTPEGKERLHELLEAERASIDTDALLSAYRDFEPFNSQFKQLMTDWQQIDENTPNDHSDADYDARVVQRLGELHDDFLPLVERIVSVVPRLAAYRDRFSSALAAAVDGDHSWLAHPLKDSYHTVWFEFHEELIGLAGLSRQAEAAAGRAE